MIILIDMDDTLCKMTERFVFELELELIKNNVLIDDVNEIIKNVNERKSFHVEQCVPDKYLDIVIDILKKPKFLENLDPFDDSIDVIKKLMQSHTVFFCSSPFKINPSISAFEKHNWIIKYFGSSDNLILTQDKTLIKADYLIDDKPNISGSNIPSWKQIIYNSSYNQNIDGIRAMNWKEIKNIFDKSDEQSH